MSVRHLGQFLSFCQFTAIFEFSYLHMAGNLDMTKTPFLYHMTFGQLPFIFVLAPLYVLGDISLLLISMFYILYICCCFAPIHEIIPLGNSSEPVCQYTKPRCMYANAVSMPVY